MRGRLDRFTLTEPMRAQKNLNFSFSGLKSQAARLVEEQVAKAGLQYCTPDLEFAADIAAAFQHTAIAHIQRRTARALELCKSMPEIDSIKALVSRNGYWEADTCAGGIRRGCEESNTQEHHEEIGRAARNPSDLSLTGVLVRIQL